MFFIQNFPHYFSGDPLNGDNEYRYSTKNHDIRPI